MQQRNIDIFLLDQKAGFNLFIDQEQAHFPFFYVIIANLNKLLGKFVIDIFYVLISSLIPIIFYKTLQKKFTLAKDSLFLLSLIIFLSPNFRSSATWVTTDNLALLFFILSVYNFVIFDGIKGN